MGTTRVKVIDLSSDEKAVKTTRKHAEKMASAAKLDIVKKKKDPKEKEKIAKIEAAKAKANEGKNKDETAPSELIESADSKTDKAEKVEKTNEEEKTEAEEKEVKKEPTKPKKESTHHQGVKYQKAKKLVENKKYSTKAAFAILPKTSYTKFDPSVEVHLSIVDKNVKGSVKYPHAFATKQKQNKYLILGDRTDLKGNIIWGNEKTINDIDEGTLKPGKDFDVVIADPKFMAKLAKVAKILGPKGMMPNPKNGTITTDPAKAISGGDEDSYQFKSDPNANIVHAKIGKLSQKPSDLEENLKSIVSIIGKTKVKKATLTSTMGPAIQLDTTSL